MLKKSLRPIDGLDIDRGHQGEEGKALEIDGTKFSEEGHKQRVRSLMPEPTQKEIDEHNVDHGVFRSWCPHCVKGKAVSYPHSRRGKSDIDQIPVVSVDYMFMSDKQDQEEEKGMPIMVIKDRKLKIIRARVVPNKGSNAYAI